MRLKEPVCLRGAEKETKGSLILEANAASYDV
jgi:hypothetical protein